MAGGYLLAITSSSCDQVVVNLHTQGCYRSLLDRLGTLFTCFFFSTFHLLMSVTTPVVRHFNTCLLHPGEPVDTNESEKKNYSNDSVPAVIFDAHVLTFLTQYRSLYGYCDLSLPDPTRRGRLGVCLPYGPEWIQEK